jgi:serine/threonine protein kinase/ABC-type branched-subunit amino acid transport system substrate-binding protein
VLKLLGTGGMGMVFQAEDTDLERPVALKVMIPDAARDQTARQRFLREARVTAAIRSDHIVTIHQVGQIDNVPYLAMELLPGESLASWMQRNPRPGPAQVVSLGLQIARGLDDAHQRGLIHRDIKPSNIWIEAPSGRVKILDFGLARLTQQATPLTQTGIIMGTPAYMAPEQAEGETVDARSDLFSLGCVLYEFASGVPPFSGTSAFAVVVATALRDPKPLREVNSAISPELSALVMHLLAKKREDRPESAADVVEALEGIAPTQPALPLLPRPERRKPGGDALLKGRPTPVAGISAKDRITPVAGHLAPGQPTPVAGVEPARPTLPQPTRRRRLLVGLGSLAGLLLLAAGLAAWLGWFRAPPADQTDRPSPSNEAHPSTVPGVTPDKIVFGMTGPFSGPNHELGWAVERGIRTYFEHVNAQGGVAGRKLELVSLDDGYEPPRALANMQELAEERKVFAFIGNIGTPTAAVTVPYALSRKMLFFGAYTGADLLRQYPPDRYVFNVRASYEEETAAVVRYLIEERKVRPEQIAVFAQQDRYGDTGFRGVARALRKYGRDPDQILRVGYERNTLKVQDAVEKIVQHKELRAVVMVPTYRPAARFIQKVKDARKDLIFTSTSFVNSEALAEELRQLGGEYADGVIITEVVPPFDSNASIVLEYREQLRQYFPSAEPSFASLEGYIDAVVLVEALRRVGPDLTSEKLVDALESLRDLDLGLGTPIHYGKSEHQALHKVWAIQLDKNGGRSSLDF